MVPFGVLLTEREIPSGINHEIKGFGEENGTNIFEKIIHAVVKPVGDTANTTVDLVGIDTSGNREFRVLTQGRRIANIRLRDVAAKVRFLSGKVSDVYINDSIYKFLGEPIAPAIVPIETLVIKIERAIHAFFGEGFDLDDAQAVYKSIFEEYKQFQAEQKNAKPNLVMPKLNLAMPKLNLQLPKQNMPTIKMQSPFVIRKNESVKEYAEGSSQEVSVDDEVMREFGENK